MLTFKCLLCLCCLYSQQPNPKLSPDNMLDLLDWLALHQPVIERGRFGFAQYLGHNGPQYCRQLSHGTLIELVQLLLNQKALVFRKGKVSVSNQLIQDSQKQKTDSNVIQSQQTSNSDNSYMQLHSMYNTRSTSSSTSVNGKSGLLQNPYKSSSSIATDYQSSSSSKYVTCCT